MYYDDFEDDRDNDCSDRYTRGGNPNCVGACDGNWEACSLSICHE